MDAESKAERALIQMPRSKLELFEDIIGVLSKKPLTIDEIAFECKTDLLMLQEKLDFLEKNRLVIDKVGADSLVQYCLTRTGVAVAKTLVITKLLEKLQTTAQTSF